MKSEAVHTGWNLFDRPITFLFLDVSSVRDAMRFLGRDIGFPLIENRFHPPHHVHGIAKYDGGPVIVAINRATPGTVSADHDHGICSHIGLSECGSPFANRSVWRDGDGHRYCFGPALASRSTVTQIELDAPALEESIAFYRDRCGATVLNESEDGATVMTANLPLRLRPGTRPGISIRGAYLIVIHAADIDETHEELASRGVDFLGAVARSEIGRTVRFADSAGHHFCLYEPDERTFAWESGPKLAAIIGAEARS